LPNLPANKCVIVANKRDENVDYRGPVARRITGERLWSVSTVDKQKCVQTERGSPIVNDALLSHNNHLTTRYWSTSLCAYAPRSRPWLLLPCSTKIKARCIVRAYYGTEYRSANSNFWSVSLFHSFQQPVVS